MEIFAAMAMDALADAAAKASCAYDLFSQVTGPILRFGSLEQVGAETILSQRKIQLPDWCYVGRTLHFATAIFHV